MTGVNKHKAIGIIMKIFTNKFILIFILAMGIFSGYHIYKSDVFQKIFFPKKYWSHVIESKEKIIEFNNSLIRSAYRDITKTQLTAKINIDDSIDFAESIGYNKDMARELTLREINNQIENDRRFIDNMTETNKKYETELENAKVHLRKLK